MPSELDKPVSTTTDHKLRLEHDRTSPDGNLWAVQAVCSCGWLGTPVAAYNDDQYFRVRQDGASHLRAIAIDDLL